MCLFRGLTFCSQRSYSPCSMSIPRHFLLLVTTVKNDFILLEFLVGFCQCRELLIDSNPATSLTKLISWFFCFVDSVIFFSIYSPIKYKYIYFSSYYQCLRLLGECLIVGKIVGILILFPI